MGNLFSQILLTNNPILLRVSSWIPGEYGMRGMLYDLTETEDFRETIKVYNPEQLVPMIYDDKLYGLPETEFLCITISNRYN